MCGRFTLIVPTYEMLAQALGVTSTPAEAALYRPRYNIAPTDPHWILRIRHDARELVPATWGLVPHWSKSAADAARSINARAETIETKPAFRDSFARRRCVVVADGFFEWQKVGKERHPLWFTPRARDLVQSDEAESPAANFRLKHGLLTMAGLDARWVDPKTGAARRSFTIVTTRANDIVAPVHDRMPVILSASDLDTWMNVEASFGADDATSKGARVTDEIRALLRPASNDVLVATPVSRRVNSVKNDDPGCIAPLDDRSAPIEIPSGPRPLGRGETAALFPLEAPPARSAAGARRRSSRT